MPGYKAEAQKSGIRELFRSVLKYGKDAGHIKEEEKDIPADDALTFGWYDLNNDAADNEENPDGTSDKYQQDADKKKITHLKQIFAPKDKSKDKSDDFAEFNPSNVYYSKIPLITKDLLQPGMQILETYWLNPPYAFVIIAEDSERNRMYRIYEPKITAKEKLLLEETDAELRAVMLYDSKKNKEISFDYKATYSLIHSIDPTVSKKRTGIICYYLKRNFRGYGRLDPLMHDENIEDITCNGPDSSLFIYHRKYSNLPVNISFSGEDLNKFVLKLAQKADKQLSLTSPLVDASLPEGARAQITYTDVVSSHGSSFTIRKFKSDPMTPVDLIDYGTYSSELMAFIWLCVENKKSAIVAGGTASGKTSMMNAFSIFIPRLAKIVSIEDTREIQMPHKNWLAMNTRESASVSGKGNVDMFALLKAALRQRPEFIIVGEVRGSEAQTLFQAMNTGHTTYSTLHAGGVDQAINRLTTNPINVPAAMFGALDLMIIQQPQYIQGRMVRRCISLVEIDAEMSEIRYNELYRWNPADDSFKKVYTESKVIDAIAYSRGWTEEDVESELKKREVILDGLLKHRIRDSESIKAVLNDFEINGDYEFTD